MRKEHKNRCADCGVETANFLCGNCAQICDSLTSKGEYWWHKVRHLDRSISVDAFDSSEGSRSAS